MQAAAAARRARGATRTAGAPRQGSAGPGCARRDVPRSTSFRSTVSITHERNAQALRVRFGGSCAEGAGQRGVRAGVCRGRLPGGGLRTRMAMVLVQDGNASPWKGLLQAGAQSCTATMGTGDEHGERYPLAKSLVHRVVKSTPKGRTMLSVAKAMGKEALCAARPLHRGHARRLRHAQLCRGSGAAHRSDAGRARVLRARAWLGSVGADACASHHTIRPPLAAPHLLRPRACRTKVTGTELEKRISEACSNKVSHPSRAQAWP